MSFLSGSVLELAATLGVALVAVTIGRAARRAAASGCEAGLTVLVLAPELYLPLRRLGAEYHASADGRGGRRSGCSRCSTRRPPAGAGGRGSRRARGAPPCGSSRCPFSYPAPPRARARRLRPRARARARPSRWSARAAPGRARSQALLLGLLEPDRRVGSASAASTWPRARWTPGAGTSRGCPSSRRCCAAPSRTTSASPIRTPPTRMRARRRPRRRARTASSARCRSATPRWSGDGGRPLSPGERRRIGLARALPARRAAGHPRRADRRPRPRERRDRRRRRPTAAARANGAADRAPARARRSSADRIVRLVGGAGIAAAAQERRMTRDAARAAAARRRAARRGSSRPPCSAR